MRHPSVFDYSLSKLYSLVKEEGAMLVQAHPYRKKKRLMDISLMDGIEISCHPKYEGTHLRELAEIAAEGGKILTCGGDYHADTHRVQCGMYLPETVTSGVLLGNYLKETATVTLCVQEVGQQESFRVSYSR